MSLKYLLDTNIVSEPLRPKPSARVLRMLRRHETEVAISSVVWHELRFGVERLPESRRRDAIERYLETVVLAAIPILDYDRTAAEWHARERARLAARGETPPFADGQIAAIAHTRDLTLITLNDADFRRFQNLRVSRWT
ncbi:MAG TPA: type II toxin-antitoxin system VapC family toxin [Thermoanaerobaculia bacterium]